MDVNDETPVFEPVDGCVHITEFHEPRDVVTVIKATDADDPNTPNGRIIFSILQGNEDGQYQLFDGSLIPELHTIMSVFLSELFKIENVDMWSARILTTGSLKARYGNYTLVLSAQDLGSPPNSATMELSICVLDINDHAPRFISPPHNTTIRIPEASL